MLGLLMSQDLREILNEECGLVGVINIPDASMIASDMLLVQQPRGEAGAGMVSSNGDLNIYKMLGKVANVFPENFEYSTELPGTMALGHNRYATKGSVEDECNLQPYLSLFNKQQFALSHNGQLIDINNLRNGMIKNGVTFQSDSDSETLVQLIAQSNANTIEEAIKEEITKIPAAYSIIIMTESKIIALRDAYGVRPLSIAKLDEGYLIASESNAFRIFDNAEFIRDINPGEMVVFDKDVIQSRGGFKSIEIEKAKERWCIFEAIYFSNPRSTYRRFMH